MTIQQQAALMRHGLRHIKEKGWERLWEGDLPTEEEIDRWQKTSEELLEQVMGRPPEPRMTLERVSSAINRS